MAIAARCSESCRPVVDRGSGLIVGDMTFGARPRGPRKTERRVALPARRHAVLPVQHIACRGVFEMHIRRKRTPCFRRMTIVAGN